MISNHKEVLLAGAITLLLFLGSCRSHQSISFTDVHTGCDTILTITIEASNLSEDMTILSTGNDECILFVYSVTDSLTADTLLISRQFQPDVKAKQQRFTISEGWCRSYPRLMIVLVEMDTDKLPKDIEPQVRGRLKQLHSIYSREGLTQGRDALGDDDLLGASLVKVPGNKKDIEFAIEGVNATDLYSYHITLDWETVEKHKH